jgi:ferredoxin
VSALRSGSHSAHRGEPRGESALLHIDWTACDGRGLCTELLPELLQRDEWGYPLSLGYGSTVLVSRSLMDAARDAVALCPRQALRILGR